MEVFTTDKWVKDARNEARLAKNLCVEVSKSLAIAEGRVGFEVGYHG